MGYGRKQSARIIVVTTAISIVVGVAVCCAAVLWGQSSYMIRRSFTSSEALTDLFAIGLLGTLPISVPTGLVGGSIAATALRRRNTELPLGAWFKLGCGWGAVLGGVGTALWFELINRFEPEASSVALIAGSIGAVTGVFVGVLVGAYCRYISRHAVVQSGELAG